MEILCRRKICKEFLFKYTEEKYPELISKVFEIGLLTLKHSFNKLLFSMEELDAIIKDLSGEYYLAVKPFQNLKILTLNKSNLTPNNQSKKCFSKSLEYVNNIDPFTRLKYINNQNEYNNNYLYKDNYQPMPNCTLNQYKNRNYFNQNIVDNNDQKTKTVIIEIDNVPAKDNVVVKTGTDTPEFKIKSLNNDFSSNNIGYRKELPFKKIDNRKKKFCQTSKSPVNRYVWENGKIVKIGYY